MSGGRHGNEKRLGGSWPGLTAARGHTTPGSGWGGPQPAARDVLPQPVQATECCRERSLWLPAPIHVQQSSSKFRAKEKHVVTCFSLRASPKDNDRKGKSEITLHLRVHEHFSPTSVSKDMESGKRWPHARAGSALKPEDAQETRVDGGAPV